MIWADLEDLQIWDEVKRTWILMEGNLQKKYLILVGVKKLQMIQIDLNVNLTSILEPILLYDSNNVDTILHQSLHSYTY